jgi:hypothetical protein
MPANLAAYDPAEWLPGPPTDEERNTYGRQCSMHPHLPPLDQSPLAPRELAGIARSRWLWARWEWAEAAGLPGAIEHFVAWLQGPPMAAG